MAEITELWRECVRWMVECGILDSKHRVAEADAEIGEFATILRDGVLLCLLCNRLCENCIDIKDLQQRPQMAQFLCCKNICEFLKACKNTFEMNSEDLFDPWDLYRLDDFGKVLRTLSKLSASPVAKLSGIRGFPLRISSLNSVEYYNDKVIYKNLRQGAEVNEPVLENAYDMGIAEEEKTSGRIYDSIVCQRSNSQRELKAIEYDKWLNFKPDSRREHCIKELYDTESNYVEKALDMIINNFYTPLEEVLSKDDHKMIFMNILELACIHRSFRDHLRQAVFYTVGLEEPSNDEKPVTIGDVFITWKEKFVAYGEYCSKLPNSRSRICYLEKTDPIVRQKIIDCGIAANRNQFHLQDLLSIPMQRVLKYHVLLSEMIKLTSVDSSDRLPLEEAKEAMQDINSYVNEMKRDYEMQQLVMDIETSITDLELPIGMHLINYGRLVKDGEIKIADQSKDGNRLKTRYVFVFDKVMIICKSLRGNQYSYRSAHILNDYRIGVDADNNNKIGTITRKLTANGGYYFSLVQELDDGITNVLSVCCKTMLQRDSWVQNIIAAQSNVRPKDSETSGHCLQYHSYDKATVCFHCEKLLAGLFYQGYHCSDCKRNLHRACLSMSKCPGVGPITRTQVSNRRKHAASLQPHECVRAVQSFHSNDPLFLSFEMNDLIEITQRNVDGTVMGRIVAFPNRAGLIQPEIVRRFRISASSLHMGSSTGSSLTSVTLSSPVEHCDSWIISSPQLQLPLTNEQRKSSSSIENMFLPQKSQSQDYVNTEVVGQQWYRGPMKRWDSEELLRGTPDGTFLVRFSSAQQKYVISISFNGDVKHTKVEQSPEGRYYLDESTMFSSVVELINYYRENNLRESFETLNTTLRHSYTDKQPYIALHNFEASEPNFLTLVVGQKVYVISRTGEDRGWWKGRSGNRVGYFPLAYVAPAEDA
ncbi:Variant SH3 domain containing protein [Brugia malayi]|uniref:BMA-VAV-1 n=1 Tax=Brugia malayi TaxID=6279 RepID=A0A0H5S3W2_BRUMA|nr:Variant SH3 domain containing protein [Brugia malayi]CRZ23156.1 BMA-VAV-1 [Brugia malayi]VIO89268.1 Variant SH3 domain containing protein [Brugia malayi]